MYLWWVSLHMSRSRWSHRKYHFSICCVSCWRGMPLSLLFMGTHSRSSAGRPPSRMFLEDPPGEVCTNKAWPCQLSWSPSLCWEDLWPQRKSLFITHPGGCCRLVVSSVRLPRGFWADSCLMLRSGWYLGFCTKSKSDLTSASLRHLWYSVLVLETVYSFFFFLIVVWYT